MAENSEQIRAGLSEALHQGDAGGAERIARQALEEGVDPLSLIQNVIVPALTEVGQLFQDFKIFLPELMSAGEAAKRATTPIEEAISAMGGQVASLGTVVIGTVANDVHDIGKNIVGTLLTAHGFRVVDLGRGVSPSAFLEAAEKEAADIVGMSSLMTTTRPAQRSTIRLFEEVDKRHRYKIVVGGGSVSQQWADEIGADGYAPDAASAAELCKELVGEK
ncbi:MAG: Methionine synthase [Anaerolineales bacterium]|nr:Methionine synthase [Anaerolineales bacterium]